MSFLESYDNYAKRVDDYSTANVIYMGWAILGAATSAPRWRIKKVALI